jgi:hypothetical protein
VVSRKKGINEAENETLGVFMLSDFAEFFKSYF